MELFSGGGYLAIDIANQYGLDKESFDTRISWVNDHMDELEMLADNADDKFRYMAGVMALRDSQDGIPTGHLVGLDACASGLQIMGAITGCPITAKNTGLTGNERMDIYRVTTSVMNRLLNMTVKVNRKDVKMAQMTHFYGSKAKPKQVFGEDTPELEAFYNAQNEVAPGAVKLMQELLLSWQPYAKAHRWVMPDGFDCNVRVIQEVDKKIEVDELDHATFTYRFKVNEGTETGLSVAANVIHSIDGMMVRELCRRCNYNAGDLAFAGRAIANHLRSTNQHDHPEVHSIEKRYRNSGFLSLVAIEHIDDYTVTHFSHEYLEDLLALIQDTLDNPSFEVVTIHDEFKCHANYVSRMRMVYVDIMAELAESIILDYILSQVRGTPYHFEKLSDNLGDDIRNGEYALS